ncbi:hypothetical protein [Methylorubrum suomiense]|uniref:hypothetical protein n=1 Tax=Methylorubrum suomiense TaxID=144191 RepID=UPI0010F7741C|nr:MULTISPECIES: hypothetical protein [Methylobacteriaceae]
MSHGADVGGGPPRASHCGGGSRPVSSHGLPCTLLSGRSTIQGELFGIRAALFSGRGALAGGTHDGRIDPGMACEP